MTNKQNYIKWKLYKNYMNKYILTSQQDKQNNK